MTVSVKSLAGLAFIVLVGVLAFSYMQNRCTPDRLIKMHDINGDAEMAIVKKLFFKHDVQVSVTKQYVQHALYSVPVRGNSNAPDKEQEVLVYYATMKMTRPVAGFEPVYLLFKSVHYADSCIQQSYDVKRIND